MEVNIRLLHLKGSNYDINIDLDPEPTAQLPRKESRNVELGSIKRPDADRLKIIKNPRLAEEDAATEKVMDELELE